VTIVEGSMSALVTGGGTGVGRCIAKRLVSDGYHVTIMGRREEPLRQTKAALGENVSFVVGDVTVEADVTGAVHHACHRFPLKVAILAAGIGAGGSTIINTSLRSWRRVLSTNLDGAFLTLRAAASAMADNGGGSIVAVSSVAATTPHRQMASYAVSKAALESLVSNAANELGTHGVRVNAIRAGMIDTDMTSVLYRDASFVSRQLAQTPLERLGSVADVADAVSFLASPSAAWITGVCLEVDGGNHLRGPIEVDVSGLQRTKSPVESNGSAG
jgi:NAD(P)-dependent dehydrogenase (short-subunit alcohol dehydrogenase family)